MQAKIATRPVTKISLGNALAIDFQQKWAYSIDPLKHMPDNDTREFWLGASSAL